MAEDRPPRRRRPASTTSDIPKAAERAAESASKPPPIAAPGKGPVGLQNKLERMIVSMSLPFAAAGDMHCASIFAQRGPVVAEAWANLAAESPAVKQVLESMLKGGAWTGAIGATIGLIMPVAAHHGAPIPNPAAVLFGIQTHRPEQQPEPVTRTPPPSPAERNGHGPVSNVPGPAAFSAPPGPGSSNATDPSEYPGN